MFDIQTSAVAKGVRKCGDIFHRVIVPNCLEVMPITFYRLRSRKIGNG